MDEKAADRIRAHLSDLLESTEFRHTEVQSRVLREIVEASLARRSLRGRELAEAVYGNATEQFVNAARHTVREIRLKLPRYYEHRGHTAVRIRLVPNEYRAEFDTGTATPSPPAARPWRSLWRVWAGFAVIAVVVAAAWDGWRGGSPREGGAETRVDRGEEPLAGGQTEPVSVLKRFEDLLVGIAGFDYRQKNLDPGMIMRAVMIPPAGADDRPRIALASYDPDRLDRTRIAIVDPETGSIEQSLRLPSFAAGLPRPSSLHSLDGQDEIPLDFAVSSLVPAELDGDGRHDELVVAVISRRHYPTQIVGLDPRQPGLRLIDYWSMGNMTLAVIPDWDGNGADEIIAYGQDNQDQGARAVILTPEPGEMLVGRGPGGPRRKMLREIEEYPVIGRTLRFPSSIPAAADLAAVRDRVTGVRWDSTARRLDVQVMSGARDPLGVKSPGLTYCLSFDEWSVKVRFDDYDLFLRILLQNIFAGRVSDCCDIAQSKDLARYGQRLAKAVQLHDPSAAGWAPFAR